MPISDTILLAGDFSAWKNSGSCPVDSFKKKNKFEVETTVYAAEIVLVASRKSIEELPCLGSAF
ncbi:hypothetical protein KY290_017881 [Solanum tuberosum]|uniref:Uncharacterized protein n=1 Tax=Solanum tuberosum TaxID=4113 RepID=A0ABQ7VCJ1_SOLTU|nr:hypothetical protein KY284_016838 [Solanum tuberosum]KAH0689682.1 hypothetical protein KY289_017040 [Solanum tuberosum]KAH0702565.1 hypothetical protein KY285_016843 [Solanum tuberosum]KAH0761808.1 hypothetical protein KY290_017881 [Solanum tuberosum]